MQRTKTYALSLHDALPICTSGQSHQEEMQALRELYDKVGLRGYWDINRRTGAAAPIEPKIWRWRDIYPALQRAAEVVRLRSEEHTSELQSLRHLVCRLLLE